MSHNPCFIRLCFAIPKSWIGKEVLIIVTILVLLDYVLQYKYCGGNCTVCNVTILVLLDYVLQYSVCDLIEALASRHNPCFIRLCFAITDTNLSLNMEESHNPCFIRLCFAITFKIIINLTV